MALLFTINFISEPLTITPTPFSMHYILFTAGVYRKEIVEKSTNKWIMAALKVHQKHKEGKEDHNFPRDHAVHFCFSLVLHIVVTLFMKKMSLLPGSLHILLASFFVFGCLIFLRQISFLSVLPCKMRILKKVNKQKMTKIQKR